MLLKTLIISLTENPTAQRNITVVVLTQCLSCVDSRWRQHPGRCGLNIAQWGVRSDVRQVARAPLWHWHTQREGLKSLPGLLRSQGWFINYWFTYCWVFPQAVLDQPHPWGEEGGKQVEESYLEWHGTISLFRFHYCYKIVCSYKIIITSLDDYKSSKLGWEIMLR